MIIRALFGTVLFAIGIYWIGMVLAERDRCLQMEKATAPVRLVMSAARSLDRNFQLVADQLTWLSWSVRADQYAQQILIKGIYGNELDCSIKDSDTGENQAIVPEGSTEYEYDLKGAH